MKKFMDKDFLLSTETARHLFHDYAEGLPIIDYHCHLSPQEIAEDAKFENITQVWLGGDHYMQLMAPSGQPAATAAAIIRRAVSREQALAPGWGEKTMALPPLRAMMAL